MNTSSESNIERRRPDWRPAELVVPDMLHAGDLMWMHEDSFGDVVVQFYKHRDTRRYLLLDDAGQAYRLDRTGESDEVVPISLDEAKRRVLGQ